MKKTAVLVAAALLALAAGAASAQSAYPYDRPAAGYPSTPHIDQREAQQQRRIGQGVRSGELTRHEARRLERRQAEIRRMEHRAKADGVVTPHERRRIAAAQNRSSRAIYRQKHDAQRY